MRLSTGTLACLLSAVALAGCSGDGGPGTPDVVDPDDFDLRAGTGAIAGLLVDDRFRPIQLTNEVASTEFQARGFVLLQETGEQVLTTVNGEFSFVDLDPGTYTLRVTASGHEATPQKVTVRAGEFAETSVVARRIASIGSTIVTQEFSIFIPCATYAVSDCTLDFSGDSGRFSTGWDTLEQFLPDMQYLKLEAKMNQAGIYCLEVRYPQLGGATQEPSYADWCVGQDSDYISGILQVDANYMDDGRDPFNATGPSDVILFYFGNNELTCWQGPPASYRCAGVGLGIRAQIITSLFLGPPEVDLEAYCLLC
jgi:hypothetical protein